MSEETTLWWLKLRRALSLDFENIISAFVATKTIRYEKFARIWQDMNFGLIYCGLSTMQEKEEFMEEAFQLAVMYLSPPFDFQQRTGGLYLIYALYFTQSHLPQIKVRLSVEQWRHLMELNEDLKKQGHLDASYILMRLRAQKAFCFAYKTKQFTIYKPIMEDNRDKWLAENQREMELAFPEDLLKKMHKTHFKYDILKEHLGLAGEEKLSFVKKSMAEIIANRVQKISDESEDETSRMKKTENRGDRIAKIKHKSFSHGVQPEIEEQTSATAEVTSGEDSSSPTSKGRRLRRGPGRKPKQVVEVTEDKPLVEKLMPKLQKYTLSDSDEEKDSPSVTSKVQNQRRSIIQKTSEKRPQDQKDVHPETSKAQKQWKTQNQKTAEKKPQDQQKGKASTSKASKSKGRGQKVVGKKPQDKCKGGKRPVERPSLSLPPKKRKKDWSKD